MLAKTFIKKWLGIPSRGVTDVAIFHPYMLNVKQPSTLYLEGQAGNHASMKLKSDSVVKAALDSQVTRESSWTKKSSTAVTCEEMFAKCVESNQIFVPTSQNTWNYESSLRHEIPKAKVAIKQSVSQDILTAWNDKVSKLTMQGEFTQLLIEEEESVTWQSIVRGLPRNVMSFCVKLASNALPSPDNLRRWGKRVMATCPLCSCPNGTLAHIINFCPVALNQGRFTWRHDSILNFLFGQIKSVAPSDVEIYCDLAGHMINNAVIPQDILVSNGFGSKPDLVIISRSSKRIALFELTCPLERNIHTANNYKREKYSGMQSDLEDKGWKVYLVPYEVSSRGQILKTTKSSIIFTLKQFKIKIKAEQLLFKQLSKIALLSTFSIFHAYQTKEWVSPPLLKP